MSRDLDDELLRAARDLAGGAASGFTCHDLSRFIRDARPALRLAHSYVHGLIESLAESLVREGLLKREGVMFKLAERAHVHLDREPQVLSADPSEPRPVDAVVGLIDLFDEYPIVALGEMHGIEQGAQFIESLVREPRFADRVNAIVVEFGNRRHQPIADAYVGGDDVPVSELRRIWHDFAGAGPWGFRAPIYPQFFATVRAVNQDLAPERRIRVLLGDPPLDWASLHSPGDFRTAFGDRDAHFASVIVDEVVRNGNKALVLAGAFHLFRQSPPASRSVLNVVQRLESNHPGATSVVLPHGHIRPAERVAVETKLANWPVPSLARLAGTWLAETSADTFFGELVKQILPDGANADPFQQSGLKLGQLGDAYLYLGSLASLTWSPEDLRPVDENDRAEVERRIALCVSEMPDLCSAIP